MTIVTGYVRDQAGDLLADATVRLYRRDTGALLGSTVTGDGTEAQDASPSYYDSVALFLNGSGSDGDLTLVDASSYNATITRNGDTHVATDQAKWSARSIHFDGNGDYLSVPSASRFNLSGIDWTLSLWAYPTVLSGSYRALLVRRQWSTTNASWQFYVDKDTGKLAFYNGTASFLGSAGPTLNQWNHLAITHVQSTNTLRMFIAGVKVFEASVAAGTNGDAQPVLVGGFYSGVSEYFAGYLQDILVLPGQALYTADFTPPTSQIEYHAAILAKPLGQYSIDTTYSGEVQRIVCAPDAWDPIANDLIDRIILP